MNIIDSTRYEVKDPLASSNQLKLDFNSWTTSESPYSDRYSSTDWTSDGTISVLPSGRLRRSFLRLGKTTLKTTVSGAEYTFNDNSTFEMWFRTTSGQAETRDILVFKNESQESLSIRQHYGSINIRLFQDPGGSITRSIPIPELGNDWNHIAVVNESGTMKIYLNGTLHGNNTQAPVPGITPTEVVLGSGDGSLALYDIDSLRMSNVVRYSGNFTPPEIL